MERNNENKLISFFKDWWGYILLSGLLLSFCATFIYVLYVDEQKLQKRRDDLQARKDYYLVQIDCSERRPHYHIIKLNDGAYCLSSNHTLHYKNGSTCTSEIVLVTDENKESLEIVSKNGLIDLNDSRNYNYVLSKTLTSKLSFYYVETHYDVKTTYEKPRKALKYGYHQVSPTKWETGWYYETITPDHETQINEKTEDGYTSNPNNPSNTGKVKLTLYGIKLYRLLDDGSIEASQILYTKENILSAFDAGFIYFSLHDSHVSTEYTADYPKSSLGSLTVDEILADLGLFLENPLTFNDDLQRKRTLS